MTDDIADNEPFAPFARWFELAQKSEPLAETMTLATATRDGVPSLRAVLLKGADRHGFVFYTNLESRKAEELSDNPHAALCFHWKSLARQVRIEGVVEPVSEDEADAYFATRLRDSQIGAWASDQSRPLASRAALEQRFSMFARQYAERPVVPRPATWSGFRVTPRRIEFWQERPFRLHDRVVFVQEGPLREETAWRKERLFPMKAGASAQQLRVRATYASLAVAVVLIVAKFIAWVGTGSVALLSSLVDSLVDAAASLVNFFAIRHAATPADREHRFGHGKAEPLAALGQSAFLVGSAVLLMFEAVRRLVEPEPVLNPPAGIAVMLFSIAVTVGLVLYQRHVVKQTGSLAIGADELHYRGDIILNLSVIATLVIGDMFSVPLLDPLFGAAVGVWIIYNAVKIAQLSLTQLMDRELPDEERARVRAIAESHPEVAAVHDIRTRIAGPTAFIQLHIEMDGEMNLLHAHEVSDAVEAELGRAFPHAEIIIHEDPAGIEEPVAFPARSPAR